MNKTISLFLPFLSILFMGAIVYFLTQLDTSATHVFEKQWERDLFIGISIGFSSVLVYQSGARFTTNSFFQKIFGLLCGLHFIAIGCYLVYIVIRLLLNF
ncbi:MAG: hypothetical protein ACI828_002564 [Flavobacteriales bacterium]|jgi:hypothetical protein